MRKLIYLLLCLINLCCISTKNTIQNIDPTATLPQILGKQFVLTETASDLKYGYSEFYPVNLGFSQYENSNNFNVTRYFNAIKGPNGENISYKLIETCCPFPSKNNKMGAGTLDLYEIYLEGTNTTKKIYINTFEKGKVMCLKGFTIKKTEASNN